MIAAAYLHAAKQRSICQGHPWVFPKAIRKLVNNPQTGQLIELFTDEGERLGTGVFNEHSLYRIRVLAYANESCDLSSLQAIIHHRLEQAVHIRQSLHLPNTSNTAYRLVNSEGDGLSGLTIDRFNQVCVVSSSAYWVEANQSLITEVIQAVMPEDRVIWLSQMKALRQDGWEAEVEPREPHREIILEAGVQFEVDFSNAQKTGLFLDQRENHARLAPLTQGKRVLDLYTYTGGFALHAANAGASKVTAVDSSAAAIACAQKNAALNHLDNIEWIEGDARDYLDHAQDYDVIILDPPKLAPSQRHAQQAKNYYRFLHREVFKSMHEGSLLLTCNCSAALNPTEFAALVCAQAQAVGKMARVLGIYGPASCHPTLPVFPEGNYLTAILLGIV